MNCVLARAHRLAITLPSAPRHTITLPSVPHVGESVCGILICNSIFKGVFSTPVLLFTPSTTCKTTCRGTCEIMVTLSFLSFLCSSRMYIFALRLFAFPGEPNCEKSTFREFRFFLSSVYLTTRRCRVAATGNTFMCPIHECLCNFWASCLTTCAL